MKRDLRIDTFRGLALMIVLVDHIEGWARTSVVEGWTLISLGYSDSSEIFVFLSGYVLAVAYTGTLERDGIAACAKKALKRSFEIYLVYLLASLSMLILGLLLMPWDPPTYNDFFRIGDHFLSSGLAAVTLRFHPWVLNILALYVLLLPPMALLFAIKRRAPTLALGISLGLYFFAQLNPQFSLPRFGDSERWFFNPLAWQLLFFLGMCLGDPNRRQWGLRPRWLWVTMSVAILGFGVYMFKIAGMMLAGRPDLLEYTTRLYRLNWEWGDKTLLQPLRLLHFFALVYLTNLLLPRSTAFWSGRLARPLVVAGQQSLEVYAIGGVIAYLAVYLINRGVSSSVEVVLIDLAACSLSIVFAFGIKWWKQRRKALKSSAASATKDDKAPTTKASTRRKRAKQRRRLETIET